MKTIRNIIIYEGSFIIILFAVFITIPHQIILTYTSILQPLHQLGLKYRIYIYCTIFFVVLCHLIRIYYLKCIHAKSDTISKISDTHFLNHVTVSDSSMQMYLDKICVQGTIYNAKHNKINYVVAYIQFFDKQGQMVYGKECYISGRDAIASNDTKDFTYIYYGCLDVVHCKVSIIRYRELRKHCKKKETRVK